MQRCHLPQGGHHPVDLEDGRRGKQHTEQPRRKRAEQLEEEDVERGRRRRHGIRSPGRQSKRRRLAASTAARLPRLVADGHSLGLAG